MRNIYAGFEAFLAGKAHGYCAQHFKQAVIPAKAGI
jgi:hypothetical protein